ncbi:MAG: hypothetical protein II866_08910 [Prevotella sp.]|nr:hypothetical protein [Prevotella sp.]
MKKILLVALMVLGGMSANAQVVFTKFKFIKDSPFGAFPTRKATDAKFKVTGDKTIKTMKVLYSGVDQVNDAVCSNIVGAVNANVKHTKYNYFMVTGPFEPGKTYSKWASGSFFYPTKVTAFPQEIYIDYMDKTSDTIQIVKDNISTFFPKIQWIDVDYEHGFQPSN